MDMMQTIEKIDPIIDRMVEELCVFNKKNPLTSQDLKDMGEVADILKDLLESRAKAAGGDMSEYSDRTMRILHLNGPDNGYSRDYSMNQRHSPVTGKYMSSSYGSGYSNHSFKDRMIAQLEPLMDSAGSEYEKSMLMEEINSIRNR